MVLIFILMLICSGNVGKTGLQLTRNIQFWPVNPRFFVQFHNRRIDLFELINCFKRVFQAHPVQFSSHIRGIDRLRPAFSCRRQHYVFHIICIFGMLLVPSSISIQRRPWFNIQHFEEQFVLLWDFKFCGVLACQGGQRDGQGWGQEEGLGYFTFHAFLGNGAFLNCVVEQLTRLFIHIVSLLDILTIRLPCERHSIGHISMWLPLQMLINQFEQLLCAALEPLIPLVLARNQGIWRVLVDIWFQKSLFHERW